MSTVIFFLFSLFLSLVPMTVSAGDIDSPGPPSQGSGMYTIEDIYHYLIDGTVPVISSTFKEPTEGPGPTMKSTKELYDDTKATFDSCDTTPDNVLEGVTFFSTDPSNWGPKTGTMPDNGAITITPTTTDQSIAEGYHNGTGEVQGDNDLIGSNIKSGATIFGVAGSVIQSTGDATEGEVLAGKTFSISGAAGLTGTMPDNGAVNITPGTSDQAISAGYHNGSGVVDGDADLVTGNIRSGATIFGVSGDPNVVDTSSGDAAEGDILKDKKAWVNGTELSGTRYGGCTCSGTLYGTRWCDNGDGTVTDLSTCLVWLKDASWGGAYAFWVDTMDGTNAHDRAAQLKHDVGGLIDGSTEGDWRLPTKNELNGLANGTEAVRSSSMRAFTGVQSSFYWSSSTYMSYTLFAFVVGLNNGDVSYDTKDMSLYVWPVRGGN